MQNPTKRSSPWRVVFILAALVATFGCGWYVGHAGTSLAQQAKVQNLKINGLGTAPPSDAVTDKDLEFAQFWDLWKTLKLKYYEDADEKTMFYGAMRGLAESLGDPYTTFFEPKIAKEFSDSLKGEFEGIGAEIGIRSGQLQIVAPLPETPAEKAGLLAGDYILAINGTSTENMSTDQAVSLIRGPKGTKVTLKIGRLPKGSEKSSEASVSSTKPASNIKDFDIVRDKILVKSVRVTWPKEGIVSIQISSFNQDTDKEFNQALDKILEKNIKGIILDLRNDPGGYLDRSTVVAGQWVGDKVVVSERRKGKIIDELHGEGNGRLAGIKTVVLVNEGSASASEIVAGALQDYGLATLIGMKTFGKGSVQDYSEFGDGSAVKITIAEWLTPKGRSINKTGIQPDIQVDRTYEDYDANRDPQLDKAIWFIGSPTSSNAIHASSTQTP